MLRRALEHEAYQSRERRGRVAKLSLVRSIVLFQAKKTRENRSAIYLLITASLKEAVSNEQRNKTTSIGDGLWRALEHETYQSREKRQGSKIKAREEDADTTTEHESAIKNTDRGNTSTSERSSSDRNGRTIPGVKQARGNAR